MIATDHGRRTAEALRGLQENLCERLAGADGRALGRDRWQRGEGGGGILRVIEEGGVFEKGGVLYSAIDGASLPPVVRQEHPEVAPDTPYFATGVSLILHPHNPFVPTVHFNVRYFEAGEVFWYGGGVDPTPYHPFSQGCVVNLNPLPLSLPPPGKPPPPGGAKGHPPAPRAFVNRLSTTQGEPAPPPHTHPAPRPKTPRRSDSGSASGSTE